MMMYSVSSKVTSNFVPVNVLGHYFLVRGWRCTQLVVKSPVTLSSKCSRTLLECSRTVRLCSRALLHPVNGIGHYKWYRKQQARARALSLSTLVFKGTTSFENTVCAERRRRCRKPLFTPLVLLRIFTSFMSLYYYYVSWLTTLCPAPRFATI